MAKDTQLYVEKRETGKYALERANAKRAVGLFDTQAEAIARAKEIEPEHKPHVARVRHVAWKHPDQFLKAR